MFVTSHCVFRVKFDFPINWDDRGLRARFRIIAAGEFLAEAAIRTRTETKTKRARATCLPTDMETGMHAYIGRRFGKQRPAVSLGHRRVRIGARTLSPRKDYRPAASGHSRCRPALAGDAGDVFELIERGFQLLRGNAPALNGARYGSLGRRDRRRCASSRRRNLFCIHLVGAGPRPTERLFMHKEDGHIVRRRPRHERDFSADRRWLCFCQYGRDDQDALPGPALAFSHDKPLERLRTTKSLPITTK